MLNLDVSQVIIQIIAFLVMFWVMKRYGWQPLLEVLEARRKKIQEGFDVIAAQKEEAKQLAAQYEEKLKGINAEARKKIQEAAAEGHKIQEQAQRDAKEFLKKAKEEIAGDINKAKNQLKSEMVNLIVATTEKLLKRELDDASQKKLLKDFVDEVKLQ